MSLLFKSTALLKIVSWSFFDDFVWSENRDNQDQIFVKQIICDNVWHNEYKNLTEKKKKNQINQIVAKQKRNDASKHVQTTS